MNDKKGPTQVSCLALGFEDVFLAVGKLHQHQYQQRQHVDLILSCIHAPDLPMHSTTISSTTTTLIRLDTNSSRAASAFVCLEACEALSIQGRTTITQDCY
ncbi:hypothetical protein D7B24_006562 [Verticillium nonalfalfae]|uniref:Uncharacterized protein n=1 Tax=Verticillium nonalfalfae TaxID=1051616 RepID=A0A3M9Y8U7_9PEZI|nr:uncharacterized protein D7B24_006562 [Verticillium nonalfalfae]RNJ56917.1 hypothetical protein D7B24_006562 [Verticillium nonalfalfae]